MLCYTGELHQETPTPLGLSIEFNEIRLSTISSNALFHSNRSVHRPVGRRPRNGMCISILGSPIHLLPANVGPMYVPVARSSVEYHRDSYVGRYQPLLPTRGESDQYTPK